MIPTARQSLRGLVLEFFPWLAGIVYDRQTKDLVIKAAGRLLCLMGGPGDPKVHRVGDHGDVGSLVIQVYGPASMSGPPSTVLITYTPAGGTPQIVPVTGLVTASDAGPFTINLANLSTEGSAKVTCA